MQTNVIKGMIPAYIREPTFEEFQASEIIDEHKVPDKPLGVHMPPEHPPKTKAIIQHAGSILRLDDYEGNIDHFRTNVQPFFYDRSKLFWFWQPDEYKWDIADEIDIMDSLDQSLGFGGRTISGTTKNNYIEAFKRIGRRHMPPETPKNIIQFKNQLFNVTTKEVTRATPLQFICNPIPWEIGDQEDTPQMTKLFDEWVGAENTQTLLQLIAYGCLPNYPIQLIFCLVGSGRNGKTLMEGTEILMYDGTWKKVENIKKGDILVSPQKDNTTIPAKVTETHSRHEPHIYDVKEERRKKRILYSCSANHQIPYYRKGTKELPPAPDGKRRRKQFRILDCKDAEYLSTLSKKHSKASNTTFSTPLVQFNQPNSNINPYALGAWLGDGHSQSSYGITLGAKKKETANYFKKTFNITNSYEKKDSPETYTYSISGKDPFIKEMKKQSLTSKNKHIPQECLTSRLEYRWKLLAGLIDTDGFIQKITGAIYYTTKSNRLAQNIKDLVFSLGGFAEIRKITKSCQNNFTGEYNELSLQFDNSTIIPLLTPKKERLKNHSLGAHNTPRNIGFRVEKRETGGMVYGFEIDSPSKWHVLRNESGIWMVTHNSQFLKVIQKFFGAKNTCSTELDLLLSGRFETAKLYKKLICQLGETNFNTMNKTSLLKKLVGQDLIGYEHKNKSPFDDYNYAKIIISSNSLPSSEDTSEGFYRRWMIIDFPNDFPEGKEVYLNIPDQEYRNLARKILKILPKLLDQGSFHNQGTIAERRTKYIEVSNPLPLFLEKFCAVHETEFMRYSELYNGFVRYLKIKKRRIVSKREFSQSLTIEGLEVRKATKGGENGVWVEGVSIIPKEMKLLGSDENKSHKSVPVSIGNVPLQRKLVKKENEGMLQMTQMTNNTFSYSYREISGKDGHFSHLGHWSPKPLAYNPTKIIQLLNQNQTNTEREKNINPEQFLLQMLGSANELFETQQLIEAFGIEEQTINNLIKKGEVFEPRSGFIQRL